MSSELELLKQRITELEASLRLRMTQGNSFISKYSTRRRVWFKKPLKKIVKYLVRDPILSTEIPKYKVEKLKQGSIVKVNISIESICYRRLRDLQFEIVRRKANYISSGRSCEKQDIKHVGVCGSSVNFPPKTFPEKITQNKLRDEKISGHSFLNLTGWEFKNYRMTLGQALKLEDYIKELILFYKIKDNRKAGLAVYHVKGRAQNQTTSQL
ncbi:9515_t:CDS:2, partial [Acaulospora morrowiae]